MSKWKWCLENDNGILLTGWQKIGDFWYLLNANGTMVTGWYQDTNKKWYYFKDNGQMTTGWLQVSDKWYYLYEATNASQAEYIGTTAYSCTKIIGKKSYTFDADGVWIENTFLISDDCINFVKSWEGYYGTPYYDEVGVKTLGYGMTGEEIEGLTYITEEEATTMLKEWIESKYAPVVKSDLDSKNITLAQNEFDALVSFAYNCGTGGLLGSTLYKNVVAGVRNADTITTNFQSWSSGGGQRIEGLYRRRTKEAAMFLNADYTGNV